MERKFNFSEGEFYHVYNRGTDKRNIFLDERDNERLIALLYAANGGKPIHISNLKYQGRSLLGCVLEEDRGETLVDIIAYCLMPNHFHLLLHEKTEGGITTFMSKLSTGYSMYFNKKYSRTGALFEGRFKAKHADEDEYLKYLLAYIHLNPIKILDPKWKENGVDNRKSAKEFLEKYRHSSYLDYCGVDRKEQNILNKKAAPEYFEGGAFEEYVDTWMEFSDSKE